MKWYCQYLGLVSSVVSVWNLVLNSSNSSLYTQFYTAL